MFNIANPTIFTTVIAKKVRNIADISSGSTEFMLRANIKAVNNNFPASPIMNHFITSAGECAAEYLNAHRAKMEVGPIEANPPSIAEYAKTLPFVMYNKPATKSVTMTCIAITLYAVTLFCKSSFSESNYQHLQLVC